MAKSMPYKYREPGVLLDLLQQAINDNWERCRTNYERAAEWFGSEDARSIDKAMLAKMRKDIRQDGPGFLTEQDGIASRLNDWLEEAFPKLF